MVGTEEGMVLCESAEGMRLDRGVRLRGRIRELAGWLVRREEDLVLPEQAEGLRVSRLSSTLAACELESLISMS